MNRINKSGESALPYARFFSILYTDADVRRFIEAFEEADAFASVLDDSLTREKAEITGVYFNSTGIASGLEIALLHYFRYQVHVSIISADRRAVLADLLVRFDNNYNTDNMSSAIRDVSRYNWFMAMHLLYGYGYSQRSLRDLEHLYRVFPEYSCTVPFRNNRDSLARITTVGREGLSLTVADLRDIIRSITFANYNYALALYSLLRSLRKYGHPMAAYATKIIAF